MDALRLPLSAFSNAQVRQYQLTDFVSRSENNQWVVTFRQIGKPFVIPFLQNDRIELAQWGRTYSESHLESGAIQEPKPVEIPALSGLRRGIWFKVAPFHIRGIIVPGSQVRILTKPSSDYFREMTKSEIEPVFNGHNRYFKTLG